MKIKGWLIGKLVKLSPWHFLIASVAAVGWGVSVDEDSEVVQGLIIGTEEYIEKQLGGGDE